MMTNAAKASEPIGRLIELRVNGAVLTAISTDLAVAADYVSFMGAVVRALGDKQALELEANKCGRNLSTGMEGIGSIPLSSKNIQESDFKVPTDLVEGSLESSKKSLNWVEIIEAIIKQKAKVKELDSERLGRIAP